MPRKTEKRKDRKTSQETRERKVRPRGVCTFCKNDSEPSYKEREVIAAFVTDRGKIIPRERSGVCARHQRGLTRSIKRARHIGLLPFLVRPE
ncbi:MAG: 30S ribosomal protein S18 [Candidatus Blackburnbacteria bacterium]|nr:30S ribosomal protein S18 [Candidatus Blackburnbacteria bacterium]